MTDPAERHTPYQYQLDAVASVCDELTRAERATMVSACGTGKTFMQQMIAERLAPTGLVVVAVPTITLIAQTMRAWFTDAAPGMGFDYLAVCHDRDTDPRRAKAEDRPGDEYAELLRVAVGGVTTDQAGHRRKPLRSRRG